MFHLKNMLVVFSLLLIAGCSGDENNIDTIDFAWPVWSSDNTFVVAQYAVNPQSLTANAPASFLVRNDTDQTNLVVNIPKIDPSAPVRQWISPDSNYIVLGNNGLRVADFNGTMLNDKLQSQFNIAPQLIAFSQYATSYFWAASESGRLVVGFVPEYNPVALTPNVEEKLLDSTTTETVTDIIETRAGSCAVRLSNGAILIISRQKGTTTRYNTQQTSSVTPGLERLHYLKSTSDTPSLLAPDFLYYLDAAGLSRINLVTSEVSQLISSDEGNITNFDVDMIQRSLLFVTSGKQVWLAAENGEPLQLLLNQHSMASFSPDGKSIAAVGYENALQTILTVLRFRP